MTSLTPISIPSNSKEECSLSLEPVIKLARDKNLVSTSCKHMFSNKAISEWMKKSTECPNCRQDIGTLTPVIVAIDVVAKDCLQNSSSSGNSGIKRRATLEDVNGSDTEYDAFQKALKNSVTETHFDGEAEFQAALKRSRIEGSFGSEIQASSSCFSLSSSSSSSLQSAQLHDMPNSPATNEVSTCIDHYIKSLENFDRQLGKCLESPAENIMVYASLGRTYTEKFSEKIKNIKANATMNLTNSSLGSEHKNTLLATYRKRLQSDTEHFRRKMGELQERCKAEDPQSRYFLECHILDILAAIEKHEIFFKIK